MMRLIVLVLVALGLAALGLAAPAAAATRKILVLPVDGNADAALRAKLTAQVVRLARSLDGQVSTADTTFADTAFAVGCEPRTASCRDEVLATLGVDELVWATATRDGAQTRLTVRRAAKGAATRELVTTIGDGAPPDGIEAGMAPLFAPTTATEPGRRPPDAPLPVPAVAVAVASEPLDRPPSVATASHSDRNAGLVLTVTGGVALGLGLALWASYASLQGSIDDHATRTRDDFDDLTALEDRAATRAIAGDVLVVAGLATAGVGAYFLLRPAGRVAIAPARVAHGAGLTLTIVGGL
jgi:hypothetical protein